MCCCCWIQIRSNCVNVTPRDFSDPICKVGVVGSFYEGAQWFLPLVFIPLCNPPHLNTAGSSHWLLMDRIWWKWWDPMSESVMKGLWLASWVFSPLNLSLIPHSGVNQLPRCKQPYREGTGASNRQPVYPRASPVMWASWQVDLPQSSLGITTAPLNTSTRVSWEIWSQTHAAKHLPDSWHRNCDILIINVSCFNL